MAERAVINGKRVPWHVHYGVSNEYWKRMREAGYAAPYAKQKDNARLRGIAWEFTPATWFDVWERSGKWAVRGRWSGKFCMGRIGDTGPYAPDNVEIIPFIENCKFRPVHRRAGSNSRGLS